ncbi:cysteine-tryptophan domain-containing zinc finger protein 3-like [Bidens hawaiensis]|uniref:cysteine-tryptophan domain-containing zinc finger protein 3-like n=1 Tax=Bidens hawaiensis TaxID=980011 RepID=UPI00404A2E86
MISVGSRDGGRKGGLSLRYGVDVEGGGDMELEEGEACFQNNNNNINNKYNHDDAIDPDVALSYLDEKLQDVLGHFQKDFEGGVSAENLRAKFDEYGSFLPTYQRSPAGPPSKTPPKVHINNASPNNLHLEGGRQQSVSISNASQTTRHGPALTSGAPPPAAPSLRGPPMNGKMKQDVHRSSARAADKFTSNGQQSINNNFGTTCDQTSLKLRIKVGSDNLSARKNAEIYSGLGLDVSPSSSFEASPVNSDDLCHVPNDVPCEESPTSILEMMTSFPVLGGLLLSPLPYDLLHLTEKEKREDSSCGSVHKRSQENNFTVNKSDSKTDQNEKKPNAEGNFVSVQPINGISSVKKEESLDFRKGDAYKGESSDIPKELLGSVFIHDDIRVEKPIKKDNLVGDASSDEKFVAFSAKADSDVSKSSKVLPAKQMLVQKATSHEKDGVKMVTSSSGSKKKSKGCQSLENGNDLKNDNSSSKNKNSYGSKSEKGPKSNNGKVRETYKDFFGELDPDIEEGDDVALEDKPFGDKPKDFRETEKVTQESDVFSKERINGKNDPKPSSLVYPTVGPTGLGPPTIGNGGPVTDTAAAAVPAVVNEDWVCCDKCEKWRLLPLGVNPGSLPEKWLCSMLDWLPGMNRCSISQEETTKAMTTHFPGPAPTVHGIQHGGPQPGLVSVEPLHPDQRHQPFGPQSGVKKKHGIKDLSNEVKQERPSLSSSSAKRNLQTSSKTRSVNDANQSSVVNEVEFQDSGHSSSLMAEKNRLKHKEKKKIRENFVDEGNNTLQLKSKNKRETSQDNSRDTKKVKTDDNHGAHKDRVFDHDGAVPKTINTSINDLPSRKDRQKFDDNSKDSKSNSKVLGINPKHERDLVKKRKSHEFNDNAQVEETSENGQRKDKKVKIPDAREEEKGRSLAAATSSSSKVSGSHKTKANNHEAKGSPVESVTSSPLRILNPDKLTPSRRNIGSVDNSQDLKKDSENDRGNYKSSIFKKELDVAESLDKGVPSLEFESPGAKPSIQGERKNDDPSPSNGSRSRKNGKGSSSRSKEKNRSSKSDIEKINLSERLTETSDVEKSKGGQNRPLDKVDNKPSVNPIKAEKGSALKKESSGKPVSIQDVKQNNTPIGRDSEKVSKWDVMGKGKPHSLPPSGKSQSESTRPPQPVVGSQKDNVGNRSLNDGVEGSDALKSIKQKKKDENQNGNQSVSIRHPTPTVHKGTPSPLRRESSSQAASAIKEAKALKHMADRLKNSGENQESNSLYFQAVLKFLYGSSLLESSYTESGKHGDMIQSMSMYGSTAKLCEYVAHEYEKVKEMAAAALAYKLAEVAYLKVVYSSHTNASKDRQELQTSLQIGPTGESPSSSASDIDNLNNPAAVDKNAPAKGVNDPQVAGNHVIAARIKPNFLRILNFAQDVNFAMEASRRSQNAYAACGSQPEHSHHQEIIKPALDFHFQDVEGLLQLVRMAMEVIST